MFGRITRILTLAWTCLWFVLIVPAHQRGQISLDLRVAGDEVAATASCQGHCHDAPAESGDDAPEPANHCAVCEIVAKLDLPVTIDLTLPPAGLADLLPLATPEAPYVVRHRAATRDRAPPLA